MLWPEQVYKVRIDRLQEYSACAVPNLCRDLDMALITAAAVARAAVCDPRHGHDKKRQNHLGRVKFFVKALRDPEYDPILISNGITQNRPDLDEPHIWDGRHRYLAAVVRGDATINAMFRFVPVLRKGGLSEPVVDYLTGKTDQKPPAASQVDGATVVPEVGSEAAPDAA
jgi:hypothetical protein